MGRSREYSRAINSICDAVSGRNKPKTAPWVECPRPAPGRLVRPEAQLHQLAGGSAVKWGMVEMICQLADEPWAPVAQGHPGAEVVR